ncbi:MAG: ABC-F family ATP-binding cassette domain-containing protein [Myxococcales bacterium]|jgi:ATP-binding cassette subfamily F protein uup
MPLLDAQGLTKAYGPQVVLAGVSVAVDAGERVGLVGHNGSGKSTLGRILAGEEPADAGEVSMRRGATVARLGQDPKLGDAGTARDAVLSGQGAWAAARDRHEQATSALEAGHGEVQRLLETQAEAERELERHGGWAVLHRAEAMLGHVGIDDPVRAMGEMSGGERRRVALARTLLAAPDLCILDEPTNHLDVDTVEWLEAYLIEQFRGAVLLITHDRYLLDRVARRTLELDRGVLHDYDGGYQRYLEAKAERLEHEARTEQNRQNFLRRELEWLRRSPKARTTKQKARVERAEDALAVQAPTQERHAELALEASRTGKTVLELHGVTLQRGGRTLVRDLTLFLTEGERLGIVGRNGAGKSSLLLAVLGRLEPTAGRIVVGKNTEIAYLSQARDGLDEEASVLSNVAGGQMRVRYAGRDMDARAYLSRFLFDADKQRQPVASLSGGERTRVALAKLLCRAANLAILDEPTNDLDVATLGALEEMLLGFGGTSIVVTHDRWFLDRVATAILAPVGDGSWARFEGDYTHYLEVRPAPPAGPGKGPADEPEGRQPRSIRERERTPRRKGGLTYGERLELQKLPDEIEAAEARVAELEEELADPELYRSRSGEVAGKTADLDGRRKELEALMGRWEELELKAQTEV